MSKAVIMNIKNIFGGIIVATSAIGISIPHCTLNVGNNDGSISTTTPYIRGTTYGVVNNSTFNYFDGQIMDVTDAINGIISSQPQNSSVVEKTYEAGGVTYKKVYLN